MGIMGMAMERYLATLNMEAMYSHVFTTEEVNKKGDGSNPHIDFVWYSVANSAGGKLRR